MVVKNDPTLMFTNAGMNQFKDLFLGNTPVKHARIADTQKCLRVSGKHNDLEEVGHDTYHHTMFEMLGNWSFGDYFKEEAISWAWEYLTDVLKVDKERLYATYFEGDQSDKLNPDTEAYNFWKRFLPDERILPGSKKDNFWEMGDQGPCGPCSEIHIDIRSDEERNRIAGSELVNKDHPLVIEIWNLVFIQYNRKADTSLEPLPNKHVDTGMGFERLCMVVQNKKSNYDTDIFQSLISFIGEMAGTSYGKNEKTDIAMRVIADHLRAVSFAIADGQLPSNNKAGYVIRRILRRAVRYGYTFLKMDSPFIHKLIPVLVQKMSMAFPELTSQQDIIQKVIKEEEATFLKTLSTGIKLLDQKIAESKKSNQTTLDGKSAFELYDTYGFPLDLTELILKEENLSLNRQEFEAEMQKQKNRSRTAASVETKDWEIVKDVDYIDFTGYDHTVSEANIVRYRIVKQKNKEFYQIILDKTPFYAESGGQIGDKGVLETSDGETIKIFDTKSENNLIIHFADKLPSELTKPVSACVHQSARRDTERNHTATHLLHYALRKVLGEHVEQKGSLVESSRLRFDFSHFQKLDSEELEKIEFMVNEMIRENIPLTEERAMHIEQAKEMGAMMLFGEKYGEQVRVIQFGDSVELCGGTHVSATGSIGTFTIVTESAVAAGIRRIEAITGEKAFQYFYETKRDAEEIKQLLKSKQSPQEAVANLLDENAKLKKKLENFSKEKVKNLKKELKTEFNERNGINFLAKKLDVDNAGVLKDICFQLKGEIDSFVAAFAAEINGKANLAIMISDDLVKEKNLHAGNIIREASKDIQGGGGGQAFFASAGGKNPQGIDNALKKVEGFII
jgi:alanyl-tRNA synthetase